MFNKFGQLNSCQIKLNEQDQSTGTGFVSFVKSEDAQRALNEMNNTQVDGRPIFVSRFVYKQENQLHKEGLTPIAQNMKKTFDNNIFVNYIPLDVTEEQVKEKFESIGKIQSIRLQKKAQKSTQSAVILYLDIS